MLNASVVKSEVLSPGLFELWITPDKPIPDFKPGQYVALGLPDPHSHAGEKEKLIKRAYSIASSPNRKDALEFYIAEVEDGELSPKLAALREGDRIFVQPKYVGTFVTEDVQDGMNLILVSTGTGIAPFISLIRTSREIDRFSNVTLIHGVRFSRDLAYRSELLEHQASHQNFRYLSIVSREGAPDWEGAQGHVQKFFHGGEVPVDPTRDHVFLCGNPEMIKELSKWLEERGFREHTRRSPGNLHFENYW